MTGSGVMNQLWHSRVQEGGSEQRVHEGNSQFTDWLLQTERCISSDNTRRQISSIIMFLLTDFFLSHTI